MEVHIVLQTIWQEHTKTDKEWWNVSFDSLMAYLSLWGFLSFLKGTSYSRDKEH